MNIATQSQASAPVPTESQESGVYNYNVDHKLTGAKTILPEPEYSEEEEAASEVTNSDLRNTATEYVAKIMQTQSSAGESIPVPDNLTRITEMDSQKVALHKIKLALEQMNIEPAALFDKVDVNGDGSLDLNEIGLACANFGLADAPWIRKLFDTDSDGFISKHEFVSAFERDYDRPVKNIPDFKARISEMDSPQVGLQKIALALQQMKMDPASMFNRVDTNGDGSLDIKEIGLACASFGIADATWIRKLFDTDEDGFISLDEFVSAFDRVNDCKLESARLQS